MVRSLFVGHFHERPFAAKCLWLVVATFAFLVCFYSVTFVMSIVYPLAGLFSGCSTGPAPRLVYKESQFASRLEDLRFCQTNELLTGRCD